MAVAVEATNSGTAEAASSVSSGTVTNAGADRATFACGTVAGSVSLTVSTFNIEEAGATLVTGSNVEASGGNSCESWWYHVVAPTTSAHDADFTASGTAADIIVAVQTLSDVDQTTPYDNVGTEAITGYFPTVFANTATSATDDLVLDNAATAGFTLTAWTGTPDTANFPIDVSSGELAVRSGWEVGAATVAIGYDWSGSPPSAVHSWLNVNQAVGGGAATPHGPFGLPLHGPFGGPFG
jgi:hypothetical protein